jgi:hypothetical protein
MGARNILETKALADPEESKRGATVDTAFNAAISHSTGDLNERLN